MIKRGKTFRFPDNHEVGAASSDNVRTEILRAVYTAVKVSTYIHCLLSQMSREIFACSQGEKRDTGHCVILPALEGEQRVLPALRVSRDILPLSRCKDICGILPALRVTIEMLHALMVNRETPVTACCKVSRKRSGGRGYFLTYTVPVTSQNKDENSVFMHVLKLAPEGEEVGYTVVGNIPKNSGFSYYNEFITCSRDLCLLFTC